MTLNANDARNEYTATAGLTDFEYTFKIYDDSDLDVYVTPSGQQCSDSDLTTAYTVSGVGEEDGGLITLNTATSAGDKVTIVSSIPTNRTTDYQNNGDFRSDTVNDDFDRVVSLTKQAIDKAERSLSFPDCDQGVSSLTLDSPVAGSFVRYKQDLTGMENYTFASGVIDGSETYVRNGVTDYTALRAVDSSTLSDDWIIPVTNDGIAGEFVIKTGIVTDNGGTLIVFNDDSNRYAERVYSGALNVRWFGALTTATAAVNTTAFQAAIDVAKVLIDSTPTYEITATTSVYVPAGLYPINTITLAPSVIFHGDGQASTVLEHAGTGLVDLIDSEPGNNVKTSVYGMWLKGNGTTNTRYGLQLSGGFYSNVIQDVLVTDCQYGMYLTDCFTLTMRNCQMRANVYGCYWFDGNAAYVENTRFEGNTNYQLFMEEAKSVHLNMAIFQFAESDDACILTGVVGATLTDCQWEGNNRDDNGYADLNISGSTACINGGFWTQARTLPAISPTTGIAIKSNTVILDLNGIMITPLGAHLYGLQLNSNAKWATTTLTSCQVGEGGIDDSSYAGSLHYTGIGYGASPDVRGNVPHFLGPQDRSQGIVVGNKNFQSLIGHPDNRGSYDEEVLLITSPEHRTNNNNTDHTMILDTRNEVQYNISGITKGNPTTITTSTDIEFKNGWVIVLAGIVDDGPGGDLEAALNNTSWTITKTGSNTFTIPTNTSALTNNYASGGTATRNAAQTVEVQGSWDKPFILGSLPAYMWVESNGRLRIKSNTFPTSDTDGTVVGTQT